jgi:NAD(P)-dependent dehydrogenase (short-subunit alcohol dehydrogenase family)
MANLGLFSLEGKVAIVTGGSRGIGRATALGLAEAGADVVVASRKLPDLEKVADEIRNRGRKALAVAAHVGRMEDIHKLVEAVRSEFGRIDILVNNAGTSPARAVALDAGEQLWDAIMNLNLKGLYFLSQAAAKVMKDKGGGKIINVSSMNGYVPAWGTGIYSMAKAAIIMLTKSMGLELAQYNIRVNAIAPGTVSTRIFNSRYDSLSKEESKKGREQVAKVIPLKRIAAPEEMVGTMIYLASDASSYLTGETILVDGGMLLRQAREVIQD